ncbi:MAG: endonuclease/exonuclease/phosphatase family protein [Planctomycetota bacterium]
MERGISRRDALKGLGAAATVFSLPAPLPGVFVSSPSGPVRLGVIADLHGGLAVDAETRLDTFLDAMSRRQCDALLQLGDFAFPNAQHQSFADKFNSAHDVPVHVIGNHEFDFNLTREDCITAWGIENAYYTRDVSGVRLIVLDGNEAGSPDYRGGYPSYIGPGQTSWLEEQLEISPIPVVILCHQPLAGRLAIDNAVEIQNLISRFNDRVLLCMNGHSHVDCLLQVGGVNYLHINSASYYWVGGDTRMAYYRDPLFTCVTIDPEKSEIEIASSVSSWRNGTPASIGYFDRDNAPPETIVRPLIRQRIIAGQTVATPSAHDAGAEHLKVMTWNIWGRLNEDPRYTVNDSTARQRTIEIIRESGADVIAMIETYGSAETIAGELGFHFYTPDSDANLCIFSRYPLSEFGPLEGLSAFSFIAATVTLPAGLKVRLYNIWLTSSGRHIVEIKNNELSDSEFDSGDDVRFEQLSRFLEHADLSRHLANAGQTPVLVAGDFNCVSHLDHTVGTRHSGLNHRRVLACRASKAMRRAGFADTYREANPDVLESTLGHTWTTVGRGFVYEEGNGFVPVEVNPAPEYRDPYARIDFIYSCGAALQPVASAVIARHRLEDTRSFPEFPSDHAAVLTTFAVEN